MRLIDPLRLYPARWRARYGDEVAALLEDRPPSRRDRVDLARGAVDAWLHPPTPSLVPAAAALVGGGLWTMLATIVVLQPVPADWPGYVLEIIPLAVVVRRLSRGGRPGPAPCGSAMPAADRSWSPPSSPSSATPSGSCR